MIWANERFSRSERRSHERLRRERMRALDETISYVFDDEKDGVENVEEHNRAVLRATRRTAIARNELTHLKQEPLFEKARKFGITIPAEHILEDEFPLKRTLTYDGEAWVQHQARVERRTAFKDWMGAIMPILSLILSSIIAILGLIVALKKK